MINEWSAQGLSDALLELVDYYNFALANLLRRATDVILDGKVLTYRYRLDDSLYAGICNNEYNRIYLTEKIRLVEPEASIRCMCYNPPAVDNASPADTMPANGGGNDDD